MMKSGVAKLERQMPGYDTIERDGSVEMSKKQAVCGDT